MDNSTWVKRTDKYGEYDRIFNRWFPIDYYTCSVCNHETLHIKDVCPNCKRIMMVGE